MAALLQFLSRLLPFIPSLLERFLAWWDKRQAAKAQAEIDARNAAIKCDPAGELQRKFNPAGQQQPDSDNQSDANQSDGTPKWWNKHG